ncbi:hypothetical protein [Brevibacillus parabrevis]|uniref:hypothetical protein n=1 Tax=Brevibacillus parabrevis TaxID=54914 RepID=UPI002E21DB5D|nr:hypothetical protein [Brevibacillus parabrevis]
MEIYAEYLNWELKQKIRFWDEIFPIESESFSEKDIINFTKRVIMESSEKIYCKRRVLQELLMMVYKGKVKPRRIIGLLLDEWEGVQEVSLECLRLKYLSIFYQNEAEDIKSVLIEKLKDKSLEIMSEANYQLGLITIFEANDSFSKEDYKLRIAEAEMLFETAEANEDNRIDAEIFKSICRYLIDNLSLKSRSADEIYIRIMSLIWETRLFSLDESMSAVFIGISRSISKLQMLKQSNPEYWIDYRSEFNNLCVQFYELKNVEYKANPFYERLVRNTSENIIVNIVEPIFKYNYKATVSKIDVLLNDKDIPNAEKEFLSYLKNIIIKDSITEEDTSLSNIKEFYPMIDKKDIEALFVGLHGPNKSAAIWDFLKTTKRHTYDSLLNSLVLACIKLQGNHLYRTASEDDRNGFIKNILDAVGFSTKDQTRWGVSNTGKSAGEVDILIEENNFPYSVIEALNLSSLDSNYLNLHINKTFKYDTTGLPFNFLISYVTVKDFGSFWLRYKKHIAEHEYPYKLETIDYDIDNEFDYSGIRIALTRHNRDGTLIGLYHICVRIYEV